MALEPVLTPKQELFCQEYLVDLNASGAARRAGYSEDTAYSIGWENLRKPEIQKRISELREITGKGFNITRERIAQELARIGFSDIRKLYDPETGLLKPVNALDDDSAAAVSGVERSETNFGDDETGGTKEVLKVKMWDKNKALDQLTRLMGFNAPEKAPVDGDGKTVTPQLHIKIIRDTASSIAPGDFTPQSTTGTESSEAV